MPGADLMTILHSSFRYELTCHLIFLECTQNDDLYVKLSIFLSNLILLYPVRLVSTLFPIPLASLDSIYSTSCLLFGFQNYHIFVIRIDSTRNLPKRLNLEFCLGFIKIS